MNEHFEDIHQELISREEIRELRYRYCYATDTKDFELVRSCFTPDVIVDYGAAGKFESRDELLTMMMDYADSTAVIGVHTAINPIIDFTSQATATVHWISQFISYDPMTGTVVRQLGTYLDQCVKTQGGWRISAVIYNMLFQG